MNDRSALRELELLTALVNDARQAELRDATKARAEIEAALGRLADEAPPPASDDPAALWVLARHDLWRSRQKGILNTRLAAATADWMERFGEAARAFGRAQAVRELHRRAGTRRRRADWEGE